MRGPPRFALWRFNEVRSVKRNHLNSFENIPYYLSVMCQNSLTVIGFFKSDSVQPLATAERAYIMVALFVSFGRLVQIFREVRVVVDRTRNKILPGIPSYDKSNRKLAINVSTVPQFGSVDNGSRSLVAIARSVRFRRALIIGNQRFVCTLSSHNIPHFYTKKTVAGTRVVALTQLNGH